MTHVINTISGETRVLLPMCEAKLKEKTQLNKDRLSWQSWTLVCCYAEKPDNQLFFFLSNITVHALGILGKRGRSKKKRLGKPTEKELEHIGDVTQ